MVANAKVDGAAGCQVIQAGGQKCIIVPHQALIAAQVQQLHPRQACQVRRQLREPAFHLQPALQLSIAVEQSFIGKAIVQELAAALGLQAAWQDEPSADHGAEHWHEAVWHGGAGKPARDRVVAMTPEERADLIRFLESL